MLPRRWFHRTAWRFPKLWRSAPRRRRGAATYGPSAALERLEERCLLSSIAVNLYVDATDATPVGDGRTDVDLRTPGEQITLRAAVQKANAQHGADEIHLRAGTYSLSLRGRYEDAAALGDLDITDHLTIIGAGSSETIIDARGIDRVFQIFPGISVTLSGMTITGGRAIGNGGGIFNDSSRVTLQDVVLTGNTSTDKGGAIFTAGATAHLRLRQSSISHNNAGHAGGAIYNSGQGARLSLVASEIIGNSADSFGGGLLNDGGSFHSSDVVLSGNTELFALTSAGGDPSAGDSDPIGGGFAPTDPPKSAPTTESPPTSGIEDAPAGDRLVPNPLAFHWSAELMDEANPFSMPPTAEFALRVRIDGPAQAAPSTLFESAGGQAGIATGNDDAPTSVGGAHHRIVEFSQRPHDGNPFFLEQVPRQPADRRTVRDPSDFQVSDRMPRTAIAAVGFFHQSRESETSDGQAAGRRKGAEAGFAVAKTTRRQSLGIEAAERERRELERIERNNLLLVGMFVIMCVNIARRRQSEKALHESEERLRQTLDAVSPGGWDWNLASGEVFFSDRWLEMLGYNRDEIGTEIASRERLIHSDDLPQFREALALHLRGFTELCQCEHRLRAKSGQYVWTLSRIKAVTRDSQNRPVRVVGMDTDITAQKVAAEEKRRLEEKIQQVQKLESLGVLAGGIAHDFNNLLVGILGGVEVARAQLPADTSAGEAVERIQTAAVRAADLCQQMLAYSGKGQFQVQPFNLSELVDEMAELLKASLSRSAFLEFQLADDLPAVVGDVTQIRQVVMNLITNAAEAVGDEDGLVSIACGTIDATPEFLRTARIGEDIPPGEYVYVEVCDTGCGMGEATVAKVFDPFFTTKFTGRGLGLAAVLGIVRGHRGAIKIDSTPGVGTTMTVLFPASTEKQQPLDRPSAPNRDWQGQGTILVVDDEEVVLSATKLTLEMRGFRVLTAEDGRTGIEMFREQPNEIDAVILDMTMPQFSGADAFREIRRIRPDACVILSSGYAEQQAVQDFQMDGFDAYLQKPGRPGELAEKVRGVLER